MDLSLYKVVITFRNSYSVLLEFSGNLKYFALLPSCSNINLIQFDIKIVKINFAMTYLSRVVED